MEKGFLSTRWLKDCADVVPVLDEASLSLVRARVRELSMHQGLDKESVENLALIATELGRNQLMHARLGRIGIRAIDSMRTHGMEVVASDAGSGIHNPAVAIQGEQVGGTSLGAGLASVCRLADQVDFDIRVGEGTCIRARKYAQPVDSACPEIAVFGRPCPGESISGDDAHIVRVDEGFGAVLADGLGHGRLAREASARAVDTLDGSSLATPADLFARVGRELAGTRGAVMGLAHLDAAAKTVQFGGAGDIGCHLYHYKNAHYFASTPLMLGHADQLKRNVRMERASAEPGAVLVMFSDGLKTDATLKGEMHVLRWPAIAIAHYLVETFGRDNDDALVLVARFGRVTH